MNRALRAATLGVLLFSPVALTACSAGQVTQTATQERDKTGAQAQVGDLKLRGILLAYPDLRSYSAGDDAPLTMAIANDGQTGDTLVNVSGTDFSGATISASGAGGSAAATGATSSSAATSTSASATGSSSASSSGATSTSATSTSATSTSATSSGATSSSAATSTSGPASGTAATSTASPGSSQLKIPAGQTVFVGQEGGPTITLTGLRRPLTTGQSIKVTFTFRKAGDVTAQVTVANPPRAQTRGDNYNFGGVGGE